MRALQAKADVIGRELPRSSLRFIDTFPSLHSTTSNNSILNSLYFSTLLLLFPILTRYPCPLRIHSLFSEFLRRIIRAYTLPYVTKIIARASHLGITVVLNSLLSP